MLNIILDDFISNKTIVNVNDFNYLYNNEIMKIMNENNTNNYVFTCNKTYTFSFVNTDDGKIKILCDNMISPGLSRIRGDKIDNCSNVKFEFIPFIKGQIIDNISVTNSKNIDIKLKYSISSFNYEKIDKYYCGPYNEFAIVVNCLDELDINDTINIHMRYYYLCNKDILTLRNNNVYSKNIFYSGKYNAYVFFENELT